MLIDTVQANKNWLAAGALLVALAVTGVFFHPETAPPIQAPTEVSKLFHVLNVLVNHDYRVIYNGIPYDAKTMVDRAKRAIVFYYNGEAAKPWVRKNFYRSPEGKVIYLASTDGSRRPLRDVLLEELNRLFPS